MCYYSLSLRRSEFRAAEEGETLRVDEIEGHGVVCGASDGMVVCVRAGTMMHIAKLDFRMGYHGDILRFHPEFAKLVGQPVVARFWEGSGGHAADSVVIKGARIPLIYLADSMEFYIGPKKVSMETKLGVDDPSIHLDHDPDPKPKGEDDGTTVPPSPTGEPTPEPVKEPSSIRRALTRLMS